MVETALVVGLVDKSTGSQGDFGHKRPLTLPAWLPATATAKGSHRILRTASTRPNPPDALKDDGCHLCVPVEKVLLLEPFSKTAPDCAGQQRRWRTKR